MHHSGMEYENGEGCAFWRQGIYGKSLYLSLKFSVNLKLKKNEVFKKLIKTKHNDLEYL